MMVDPAGPEKGLREFARYAGLGFQFGLTFLVFCGLGYVLDRWLETGPYGLLGGVFLGGAGASYGLWSATLPASEKKTSSEKKKLG